MPPEQADPAPGEIWIRGDNGRPVLLLSNEMWNQAAELRIVCSVLEGRPDQAVHQAYVPVESTGWTIVPGLVFWLPASALARRAGNSSATELDQARRILMNAIGP